METVLQQCERHVREGAERIARQWSLIAELERDGHAATAQAARLLVAEFEAAQQLGVEHLARERAKA